MTADTSKDAEKPTTGARRDEAKRPPGGPPPAGPHADPDLVNEDATPGAGSLPDPKEPGVDPAGG